ncbi:hypothetical protein AGMMS49944_04190 [Spirochaetia bacterium]|nr:hypothetical protein AGMMS49944_04190 [Spirochaetia bacterium]
MAERTDIGLIYDKLPFDFTKGVDENTAMLRAHLIRNGFTEKEADTLLAGWRKKYGLDELPGKK